MTRMVDNPKGHPTNPMTKEEVEGKFRALARRFLPNPQVERIIKIVWNIDRQDDLSALMAACAVFSKRR